MANLAVTPSAKLEEFLEDESKFALAVLSVKTNEQAQEFIEQLALAKDATKRLKRLHDMREHLVILEKKTYIEFYRRGFIGALTSVNKNLAGACRWFESLPTAEQEKILNDGSKTLNQAYNAHLREERERFKREYEEYEAKERLKRFHNTCEQVRSECIEQYKKDGKVNISSDRIRTLLSPIPENVADSTVHDFIDGTKDALLKAGAYGIGGGEYRKIEDSFDLSQAIEVRVRSIAADIASLNGLISEFVGKQGDMNPIVLSGKTSFDRRLNEVSLVYLLMLFNRPLRGRAKWRFATDKVAEELFADIASIIDCAEDPFNDNLKVADFYEKMQRRWRVD